MKLTSKKVQRDVRDLLLESELAKAIDGGVYHAGTRPRDSRAEDAVVIFTGGVPDQIDEGVVTLNIYVPDVLPYGEDNGVQVEDLQRVEEIEELARSLARSRLGGLAIASDYCRRSTASPSLPLTSTSSSSSSLIATTTAPKNRDTTIIQPIN